MELAREITYLRTLGLGDVDLSRAAGSATHVRRWPPSEPDPSGRWDERIRELTAIAVQVEEIAGTDAVAPWLRTSMPTRGWTTPLDLIGQDRGDEVAEMVSALAE